MKRIISILVVVVLVMSFFVGCNNDNIDTDGTTITAVITTTTETVMEEEFVNYDIYFNWTSPQFPEDGGIAKEFIKKKLSEYGVNNVDFKITVISGADYNTKLNLLVASGDVPDYFHLNNIELGNRLADEGMILEISDELLAFAPNYTRYLREEDVNVLTYNDKLYLLPQIYRPEVFNGPNVNGFVVREDWLTNLGIENPTTLDELHDMLYAFTYNDPDKNGENDTFGLGGQKGNTFDSIFGAFGVIPNFWFERNNKLKQGFVLFETKEALKVLRDWYAEGLIDPDFPIMDGKQRNEKVTNSKIGVFQGSAFNTSSVNSMHSSLRKLVEGSRLIMLNTPEGPNGEKGWSDTAPGGGSITAISANAPDPQRLMKILDWATSDEGALICQFGRPGEEFVFHEDTNTVEQFISANSELYALGFGNPARFISVIDRRWMTEWGFSSIEKAAENIVPNKFWRTVPSMFDYPDLNKLWDEYMIKIITGIEPIDAFDTFIEKYYKAGGKIIEEEVNALLGY